MLKAKFTPKGKNTSVQEFAKIESRIKKTLEEEVTFRTKELTRYFTERLLKYTPVYSGKTLRNFRWQQGRPYSGPILEALGIGKLPRRSMDIPMGSEERRPANERDVWIGWSSLNFKDPKAKFYIVNKYPLATDIDQGTVKVRMTGMFRRAVQDVKIHAKTLGKKRVSK